MEPESAFGAGVKHYVRGIVPGHLEELFLCGEGSGMEFLDKFPVIEPCSSAIRPVHGQQGFPVSEEKVGEERFTRLWDHGWKALEFGFVSGHEKQRSETGLGSTVNGGGYPSPIISFHPGWIVNGESHHVARGGKLIPVSTGGVRESEDRWLASGFRAVHADRLSLDKRPSGVRKFVESEDPFLAVLLLNEGGFEVIVLVRGRNKLASWPE